MPTVSGADPTVPNGFIRFDDFAVIDASHIVAVTVPKRTVNGTAQWEVQVAMAAAAGGKVFSSAPFAAETDAVDLWTRTLHAVEQART